MTGRDAKTDPQPPGPWPPLRGRGSGWFGAYGVAAFSYISAFWCGGRDGHVPASDGRL